MDRQKKLATLKAVLAVAWCDGNFDQREERLVMRLVESFGLEIDPILTGPADIDSGPRIKKYLPSYDDRLACYKLAMEMSRADGIVVPEEVDLLRRLRASLFSADEALPE